ncbi:hypothetical protein ACIBL3_05605 [Kribbella sp. NPDC050124]
MSDTSVVVRTLADVGHYTRLAQPEPEKDPAELMRQMVEASR